MEEIHKGGRIAVCRPPICPEGLFMIQGQAVGGRPTSEILFCDHLEVLFTLVEAGYAFAITADIPGSQTGGLCRRPIADVEPLDFGTLSLPGQKNPGVRRLVKLLEETLEESST